MGCCGVAAEITPIEPDPGHAGGGSGGLRGDRSSPAPAFVAVVPSAVQPACHQNRDRVNAIVSEQPDVAAALAGIRRVRPLVHCITNDVVMNPTANALLALG